MIVSGTKEEDVTRNIISAVKDIVQRCKSETDLHLTMQKIHLFLAINSDFGWPSELDKVESVSSCLVIRQRLTLNCYFEIIRQVSMWRHLVFLLKFLPPTSLMNVVNSFMTQAFTVDQSSLLTGVILSFYLNPLARSSETFYETLEALINKFKTTQKSQLETSHKTALKLSAVLNCLILLNEMLISNSSKKETSQDVYQDILFCGVSNVNLIEYSAEDKKCAEHVLCIENLLTLYKDLMNEITIQEWMDGSDISTEKLLSNTSGVEYWPTDTAAPSNIQMLIAHTQALCCERLKEDPTLASPLVTQIEQMLSATAKLYTRSMELDIDNLDLEQIFSKLKENNEDWKINAYVNHIMSLDDIDQVLSDKKYLEILMKYTLQLKQFVEIFIMNIFNSIADFDLELKKLVNNILMKMSLDDLVCLFNSYHLKFGLESKLKTDNFSERLTLLLNKHSVVNQSSDDGENIKKEIFLLGIEDGKEFLRLLLLEAAENSGKVNTVGQILKTVPSLCKYKPDDNSRFILTNMTMDIIGKFQMQENKVQNIFSLLLTFCDQNPDICLQALIQLLQNIFRGVNEGLLLTKTDYLKFLHTMIKHKNIMKYLAENSSVKTIIVAALAYLLSFINGFGNLDNQMLSIKTTIIESLKVLRIRPKFAASTSTLKKTIQEGNLSTGTSVMNSVSSEDTLGELMCIAHLLIDNEWEFLCRIDSTCEPIFRVLEILISLGKQEADKQACYHMIRSVCTEMPLSWQNVLLLIRLLFIIEDEDQRKIVWSCIHNNLSKLLNEGQECHLETRKTLELLLLLDEANHDQITIAIKLLNKQSA